MPIIANCPECDRKMRVPDDLLGKRVKCPACGTIFQPGASKPNPPAPVESPFEEVDDSESASDEDGRYEEDRSERRRPRRPRYRGRPHRGALVLLVGFLLPPLGWV